MRLFDIRLFQKELFELSNGILGRSNRVSNCPLARKDLEIVSALEGLVSEEMDLIKIAFLQVLQAISLIPSCREHVEADLSTDAVSHIEIRKLFLHRRDHSFANIVLQIKFFIVVPLLPGAVASNRRNIEHSTSEFDEGASLDGKFQIGEVPHDPVDNALDVVFSQMFSNGVRFQKLAVFVGDQPILAEIPNNLVNDSITELFFLFWKVRSSDDADSNFLAKSLQDLHHVFFDFASRDR
mmetsp:Transcript_4231/g.9216  ORF Transcript_4231/g.9216 Transcript_4231/m.9216 type:complete len:239 (-) Transcript_4231:122-838(-)